MFGQLKERFLSFQEDISSSVKQFVPSEQYVGDVPPKHELDAGSGLLEAWQNLWEEIHLNNERNAKSADSCDLMISKALSKSQKQVQSVHTLQAQIPVVNQGIQNIMTLLASIESTIGDVELSLLALEDTLDAKEMQDKQLDHRFQLALYQERRKAEFNDLAGRMQSDFEKKRSSAKKSLSKEAKREKHFQLPLENSSSMLLQVPCRHDPDASLESVDLDDPEDDAKTLEAFLNEPDALYDLSPLPKDEVPLQKENVTDVATNVVEVESESDSSPKAGQESGLMSVAESIYFTPDVTAEKLSEVSLN